MGVSHDTAALPSTPSGWWKRDGADLIATAAAGSCSYWPTGGSNSCRTGAWKTELQNQLCNSFGLTVTVAHYPAGASRWNPIEHRLFSEISKMGRRASSQLPQNPQLHPQHLHPNRSTVSAYLDLRHSPTGTLPDPEQVRRLALKRHSTLPAWNYTITTM